MNGLKIQQKIGEANGMLGLPIVSNFYQFPLGLVRYCVIVISGILVI